MCVPLDTYQEIWLLRLFYKKKKKKPEKGVELVLVSTIKKTLPTDSNRQSSYDVDFFKEDLDYQDVA